MISNSTLSQDATAIAALGSVGLGGNELAVALLEQSEDCIKILSVDGYLEFMNCGGLSAMEIDDPALVYGKLWWELWPEAAQQFVQNHFQKAAAGLEVNFAAECPTAKGSPRRWEVNLRPLLAPAGAVVSVLSTSRDVSGGA